MSCFQCAVAEGHVVGDWTMCGHRDMGATSCPGQLFYDEYVVPHPNWGVSAFDSNERSRQ